MAATQAAEPTFPDERSFLLVRIAGDLAPHLADKPQDRSLAMNMAWRMVKAYHPCSEAEVTGAARIVSLSMTQLDLLRDATQADLTPAMRLRFVQVAVNVNRAIGQNERALERQQRAEERRAVTRQALAPERVNRSTNEDALREAMMDDAMEECSLMRAVHQQGVEAARSAEAADAAPPTQAAEPAQADPADPAATEAPLAPQPDPAAMVAAFARQATHSYAQRHQAPRAEAATPSHGPRPAGAGSSAATARAAGPG